MMENKASCELCKARKVKCDRAEPACSWCAKHNRQCIYLRRQPPGSRGRLDAELLEVKVNRIESLLRTLGRRVEEHIVHDHAAGSLAGFHGAPSPSALSSVSGQTAPPSLPGGFRPDAALDARARPDSPPTPLGRRNTVSTPQWGAPRPDQTPSSVPAGAGMQWEASQGPGGRHDAGEHERYGRFDRADRADRVDRIDRIERPLDARHAPPRALEAELPPHDVLYTLVDLYFKHCNTWCPILDRKTVFGVFFGATSLDEPDRVLLHAIVATTLRFAPAARLPPAARRHYHAASRQVVRLYAMDHVSVPALRALVVLSLDEFGTSCGPRAWSLLAVLAQNLQQLGLCDEASVFLSSAARDTAGVAATMPITILPDSWIEDEGRRRLCWVVYLLDRYATVGAATADFLLDDRKMRRFLPCAYDLFSKNVPVPTRPSSNMYLGGGGPPGAAAAAAPGMLTPLSSLGPLGQPPPPPLVAPPEDAVDAADAADAADDLGSFSYHCELLRSLSRVHDFVRAPADITSSAAMARWRNTYLALDATLDGWLRGLPSEFSKISALCHSDPVSRVANWFMLHSAYVTAVVRLHAPAAYPAARSALFAPSQYAVQRCLAAVHSLADIARDLREANGLDLLGPPFAFSLWVAARLLLVHASTADAAAADAAMASSSPMPGGHGVPALPPMPGGGAVDGRVDFFIETLRHIGAHWEVASQYAAVLERVVRRARQGERTLAQMRRSAHDLLVLAAATRQSGAEPPSTQVASLCELDGIEVFAFFAYPQMPGGGGGGMGLGAMASPGLGMMSMGAPEDARLLADKRAYEYRGVPAFMGL